MTDDQKTRIAVLEAQIEHLSETVARLESEIAQRVTLAQFEPTATTVKTLIGAVITAVVAAAFVVSRR